MSSILDALNKLEEDKARTIEGPDVDIEAATADLVGRSAMGERLTLRLRPATFIAMGSVAAVALVAASVGLSVLVLSKQAPQEASGPPPDAPAVVVATAQTEPAPPDQTFPAPEPTVAPTVEETPAPIAETEPAFVAEVTPAESRAANAEVSAIPAPQTQVSTASDPVATARTTQVELTVSELPLRPVITRPSQPKPSVEHPRVQATPVTPVATRPPVSESFIREPVSTEAVKVARATTPERPRASQTSRPLRPKVVTPPKENEAPLTAPAPQVIVSIRQLPLLTPAIEARHALPALHLNMVRPAGPSSPHDMAVINRVKVYAGDRIQNSRARLLRVESYGIAVGIVGTNDNYFIPF